MNETRELLERVGERFAFPEQCASRRSQRRRDRKRRKQRIAAGVVGFAVFLAAIALVALSPIDRSRSEAGGTRRRGPAPTVPPKPKSRNHRPAHPGGHAELAGARTPRPLPRRRRGWLVDSGLGVRRRAPDLGRYG